MFMSTSMARETKLEVNVKRATSYENRGDGYKDHPDPSSAWLELTAGAQIISVRLTPQQLCRLQHTIGAFLQDLNPPAESSSLWPEGEPLTAQQIRGALKPGDMVSDYKDCSGVEFPE